MPKVSLITQRGPVAHQLGQPAAYVRRRALGRLPGTQRDDLATGGAQLGHPVEDAHHRERRHGGPGAPTALITRPPSDHELTRLRAR